MPMQLEGENGGVLVDAQVRSQLSALLYQLSDRLPEVAEEVCKAAALLGPLEVSLPPLVQPGCGRPDLCHLACLAAFVQPCAGPNPDPQPCSACVLRSCCSAT